MNKNYGGKCVLLKKKQFFMNFFSFDNKMISFY